MCLIGIAGDKYVEDTVYLRIWKLQHESALKGLVIKKKTNPEFYL